MNSKLTSLRGYLLAVVMGILGLWQFHIPQFASNFDKFPGDRGDARLVAYLMEHWYQVFQGLASWRSPMMFYPVEGTIGYADLLLGYGILYSSFRALGMGIFEAAEFTIILFNFLNYVVCFVLLRKVLNLHLLAAIAGASFFAYNSPKLVQMGHPQLQPIVFLPLTLIPIILLLQERADLREAKAFGLIALAALSLVLQLLTGFYIGWFFIFWSALFVVLCLLFRTTRRVLVEQLRKFWRSWIGGLIVFMISLIPFLLAYLPIVRAGGGRPYEQVQQLIPVPRSLLLISTRNYLWGKISAGIQSAHPVNPELQIGIGLIPLLAWFGLIAFAVWFIFVNSKADYAINPVRRASFLFLSQSVIATTLFYLIGMNYGQDFSPWKYVYWYVPGAQAIRGVARYALMLALPMAIAFGFGIHVLIERFSRLSHRKLLLTGLLVLTSFGLLEQFARKEGFNGFSITDEKEYLNRFAQSLPKDCSSFYVSVKLPAIRNQFEYQIDAVLISVMKGVPTLNGYSGQWPANWHLWEVRDPAYENNVRRWIDEKQIKGNVCRLAIHDNPAPVDIGDPQVFLRQQYLDILRREPDPAGKETWVSMLNNCLNKGGLGADQSCDRIRVALGILESREFEERSSFVLRLYLAVLGRRPLYDEFVTYSDAIVSAQTANELKSKKEALIAELFQRPEFQSIAHRPTSAAFEEKSRFGQNKSNASALREVLDDQQTVDVFRNQTLVLIQYFANLNRDPESWEYEVHLNRLNATGDYRQLIFDFLYSVEYRKRFGYSN